MFLNDDLVKSELVRGYWDVPCASTATYVVQRPVQQPSSAANIDIP